MAPNPRSDRRDGCRRSARTGSRGSPSTYPERQHIRTATVERDRVHAVAMSLTCNFAQARHTIRRHRGRKTTLPRPIALPELPAVRPVGCSEVDGALDVARTRPDSG